MVWRLIHVSDSWCWLVAGISVGAVIHFLSGTLIILKIVTGSKGEHPKGASCIVSKDLVIKLAQNYFCYILLIKAMTKIQEKGKWTPFSKWRIVKFWNTHLEPGVLLRSFLFVYFKDAFIYLPIIYLVVKWQRQREREKRERGRGREFYQLTFSSNFYNIQEWTRPRPEHKDSI